MPVPFGVEQSAATIDEMGPRVLIVEDESSISEPRSAPRPRGVRARGGGHDATARDAFERDAPDVVLLDVMLPDGDGRDFCRDLRAARTCRS